MSTEARITQLPDEVIALRGQVATLREVLETKLERIRVNEQHQFNEARQSFVAWEEDSVARVDHVVSSIRSFTQACKRAIHAEELRSEEKDAFSKEEVVCAASAEKHKTLRLSRGWRAPVDHHHRNSGLFCHAHRLPSCDRRRAWWPRAPCRRRLRALLPRLEEMFDFYAASHDMDSELL